MRYYTRDDVSLKRIARTHPESAQGDRMSRLHSLSRPPTEEGWGGVSRRPLSEHSSKAFNDVDVKELPHDILNSFYVAR